MKGFMQQIYEIYKKLNELSLGTGIVQYAEFGKIQAVSKNEEPELCCSSQLTENPALWKKKSLVPTGHSVPVPLLRTLAGLQIRTTFATTGVHVPLRPDGTITLGKLSKAAGITYSSSKRLLVSLTICELSILLKHKRQTTLLIYSNTRSISTVTKYCKKQNPVTHFM